MTSNYITLNKNRFHYRQFGRGAGLLFCFHGYGRDSFTFEFLANVLGNRYTIIAIDAPYHGETQWDDLEFHPKDLVQVLKEIRQQVGFAGKKVALLGFSMGGRIALHISQELAPEIERIVLLAPDGLRYNFWQWFSTHTWIGLKVFDFTINHPQWFLRLVNFVEKRKLVSRNLTNMIRYYFEDNDQRLILYRRWIIMRKFKPHLRTLKKTIAKNNIRLRMLFGSYDRIIHSAGGHAFLETIEEYATVKIIDAGHDLLREWHSATIAELFND